MFKYMAQNPKFQKLFALHAKEFITQLKNEGLHFSIACDTSLVCFDPPLIDEIKEKIGKVAIFILSGYSFESLEVFDDFFVFEAGLILKEGEDIGTILKIPYASVIQILAQDEDSSYPIPIFVNPFETKEDKKQEDSMHAILSKNPNLLKG
ncbi:hypothetical protein [Helicobacter kayseriensis]|uniref:hypothetical protein n=1 Tax=Helicobacter kayseriensis TaxID=2905877 RepID=UPI001E51C7EE|nr:hypothetical protein [Helicobacter kayseriensis]MCE3046806.1 hypothetical protein [Helicobacter kayseriensis]MCE3047892.1 hypothetical protein [Helicobacter kayseriensis]